MVNIISREGWRARAPRSRSLIDTPVDENWLHHTAGSESGTSGMRSIQNYHMDSKGWSDIGYSWVYDPATRTWFQARGWGVAGAHTGGRNSISHGFAIMGNYQVREVTQAMIDDIAWMVVSGHKLGWGPAELTGGHRDVGSTACPGNNLYNRIEQINNVASRLLAGGDDMKTSNPAFQEAFDWAVAQGIFSQYTNPLDNVTAETLAVFLQRAANKGVFEGDFAPKSHSHNYAPKNHTHQGGGDHTHEATVTLD